MTENQFLDFLNAKKTFKTGIENLKKSNPNLKKLLMEIQEKNYDIVNPLVYNEKFDEVSCDYNIKYIWITDNPGVKENQQNRYGVGSSGNAGKNFMESHGLLEDFDREVLILNKSPIHTRITAKLAKLKGEEPLYSDAQKLMAELCYRLQSIFKCQVWILGTSNLDKIFLPFKLEFQKLYKDSYMMEQVFLYNHFSQGQFKRVYNIYRKEHYDLKPFELCKLIGDKNRKNLL